MASQQNEIQIIYKNDIHSSADSIIKLKNKDIDRNNINDSISQSLIRKGFLNHLIKQIKMNDSLSRLEVILNKNYTYIRLSNNLDNLENIKEIISLSRKRNIISINKIEEYLSSINQILIQNGYSFAEVQLDDFEFTTSDTINATLTTSIKAKRFLDKIQIKGYKKFPLQLLKHFTNGRNLYNDKTITKLETSISSMPFVKKTKDSEVLFKKDSTQVFLYLEKITTNTADGMLGFNNTNEGKLELNGFVNLKLQNNLDRAETFLLAYRNDNGDQTQFMTSIDLPYVFKTAMGIHSLLEIQRRDSTYQRTNFKAGLFYKPSWQINTGINYINSTSTATGENVNVEDFTKNGIEIDLNLKQATTDKLMPENMIISTVIGLNKRELQNNSENQLNFHATFFKLWHLSTRSKFLSRLTSNYLKSENIQFNELYQFGGLGSIRGFNQNSIDSSFYTTFATEYRYRLNDQIYLHSILDLGVFENFNSKKVDKLYGYGGGIAILTQAGILNLSIANGRFNDAKVDLSSTVAHINLKINF